jgi:hypothetical protein
MRRLLRDAGMLIAVALLTLVSESIARAGRVELRPTHDQDEVAPPSGIAPSGDTGVPTDPDVALQRPIADGAAASFTAGAALARTTTFAARDETRVAPISIPLPAPLAAAAFGLGIASVTARRIRRSL